MNSWLRGLLYTFAFLLLFVWVGLGLFDAERAKGPIANWLSQQTGVPVTIGRLVFNPLHPYTLLAEQVRYGDAVQLEKLYLEIEHIDWLNRDVRIAHLDLIRPVIKLPLPNQLPSLPVHSLTISDSTIDNLSLQSEALTLRGLSASLSDWELIDPRRQPQANLTLGINQLETPMFTLARLSLKGRLEGQVLSTDRLTTNLFDGLLETGMVLNWPERSLQLHDLKARAMRLELGDIPPGEFPPAPHHPGQGPACPGEHQCHRSGALPQQLQRPAHRLRLAGGQPAQRLSGGHPGRHGPRPVPA